MKQEFASSGQEFFLMHWQGLIGTSSIVAIAHPRVLTPWNDSEHVTGPSFNLAEINPRS
jgi:hypothetical protein